MQGSIAEIIIKPTNGLILLQHMVRQKYCLSTKICGVDAAYKTSIYFALAVVRGLTILAVFQIFTGPGI